MSSEVQSIFDEFLECCRSGNYDKCEQLFPQIHVVDDDDDKSNEALLNCLSKSLEAVCLSNQPKILELLLTHPTLGKELVNGYQKRRRWRAIPPLIHATENNSIECLKILLSNENIDPNKTKFVPGSGWYGKDTRYTSLYKACENNNIEAVKLLISHPKSDGNEGFAIQSDKTPAWFGFEPPLCIACKKGNMEIVKILVSIEKVDINRRSIFDTSCSSKHYKILNHLLEQERIDTTWIVGKYEPFERSICNGNVGVLIILLASKKINHEVKKEWEVHEDSKIILEEFKKIGEENFAKKYKDFEGIWKPEFHLLFSFRFQDTIISLLSCCGDKFPVSQDVVQYGIIPFLDPFDKNWVEFQFKKIKDGINDE